MNQQDPRTWCQGGCGHEVEDLMHNDVGGRWIFNEYVSKTEFFLCNQCEYANTVTTLDQDLHHMETPSPKGTQS